MNERATFSLLMFLGLITITALGCWALVNRSPWSASVVVSLTMAMLGFSVLMAIVFRKALRAFWVAFAFIGWLYMLLAMHPWFSNYGSTMLTSRVLVLAWTKVDKESPRVRTPNPAPFSDLDVNDDDHEGMMDRYGLVLFSPMTGMSRADDSFREFRSFLFIGQSLWAILFGFLGGLCCGVIYTARQQKQEAEQTPLPAGARPPVEDRSSILPKGNAPDSSPFSS